MLFKSNRVNGQIDFVQSFKILYSKTIDMYKYMYSLLPKYVFILAILFTFTLFCCKIWKERNVLKGILEFFYIVLGITFVAVFPIIVEPTDAIWFVPRVTYCFASMFGIILLYIASMYNLKVIDNIMFIGISSIIIMLQLQRFYKIENDRYFLNEKDEKNAMQIVQTIKQYEAKANNTINKIEFYNDQSPNYTYEGIFAFGDTNVKCFANDWSTVQILEYYLNRKLELLPKDQNKEAFFAKQNWKEFNIDEQVICSKDILILCNY